MHCKSSHYVRRIFPLHIKFSDNLGIRFSNKPKFFLPCDKYTNLFAAFLQQHNCAGV